MQTTYTITKRCPHKFTKAFEKIKKVAKQDGLKLVRYEDIEDKNAKFPGCYGCKIKRHCWYQSSLDLNNISTKLIFERV